MPDKLWHAGTSGWLSAISGKRLRLNEGHDHAGPAPSRPRLALIATSPFAINAFWPKHLEAMRHVYDVTVLVNEIDAKLPGVVTKLPEGVRLVSVEIQRNISPIDDLQALRAIYGYLASEKPPIVITMTPKAGLIGMLAGRMARVPVRIHWFTGQVWATSNGVRRKLLKAADKIIVANATILLADSHSQAELMVREGIVAGTNLEVLGSGSVNGVDCARFMPNPHARSEMRAQYGFAEDDIVLVFAGRINRDKGIPELIEAFGRLTASDRRVRLLLVGPDEGQLLGGQLPEGLMAVGYTLAVERTLQAADIFCLPSHREGFGQVLIEAGACGLPSVASRIYGITDAVVDGVTGLLHAAGDPADIFDKVHTLVSSPQLRATLGRNARERAIAEFSNERLTGLLMKRLESLAAISVPSSKL